VGLSVFFSILVPPAIRDALDYINDRVQSLDGNQAEGTFSEVLGAEILTYVAMVLGFYALSGFFMYLMRKTIIVMSRLIEYDLRKDIYAHYQQMDLSFFKRNKTGDLMARVSSDVSKVRMYLGPAIMYGIRVTFLFSFIIYSMFQVSATLSWYALLPLPFLSISIYYVSSIINKKSAIIQEQVSTLNSTAQEVYSGIRIVKSYVKESEFQAFFKDQSLDYRDKALKLAKVQALFFPLMILLVSLSTLLTIYVGGGLVVAGEISTGNIAEFVIYINMLTWPITSIGWIASLVQQAEASQARINEIMHTQPSIQSGSEPITDFKGRIEFKDVSFTYPDTGIEALKNISFVVEPGERLIIVGKTASGKSTIAELLLRFYNVTSGAIYIDGKNINTIKLESLRQKMGYVPQNVFLFSDLISENIKFGAPHSEPSEIRAYAEKAAVAKDIKELPEQYETQVGERGVTLSGGQKQRISLARALIKNPDVILLDDSLSALDANTEHAILEHLDTDLKGKTCIIITHRISNQLDFDKVIVLADGKIEHQGTHSEVVNENAYYNQLVQV
jgi:ATP-binding cassette subfamily B protein